MALVLVCNLAATLGGAKNFVIQFICGHKSYAVGAMGTRLNVVSMSISGHCIYI